MEWYWWLIIAAAINWGGLLLLYVYPLAMTWLWKDFVFEGFYGPFGKFRLANTDLEPWHAARWRDWGGVGLGLFMCYRDRPGAQDDAWVARTIVHEGTHCWQWLILGLVGFFLSYFGHAAIIFVTQKLKGKPYTKHAYLDIWAERMARKRAGQLVDIPPDQWMRGPDDLWPWW